MQFFRRFLSRAPRGPDPRDSLRPLWHKIVEMARDPAFYRDDGVADTLAGRFDMITMVLSIVLLRMERDRVLTRESALLTELFVEDMDSQLRESGIGDMVVGKHIGRLVSVLGGRLGALRDALSAGGAEALEEPLARNVTMAEGNEHGTAALARRLRGLADRIAALDSKALLAGEIAR